MELPACAGVCRTNLLLLHSGPIPNEIGGKSLETQQKMTITMDYHKKFKKLADVFASDVVRDVTSDNRWAPSQRGRSSRFNDHTAEGHATF